MGAFLFGQAKKTELPTFRGPYLGQTPPGNKPERFLPSIFGNTHSSVTFAPDGNQVYWNAHDSLHMMEQTQGEWTPPRHLKFFETSANEDVPFLSQDGRRLYFYASFNGDEKRHQRGIWYVDRIGDAWSSPRSVGPEINRMFGHWQFSVSAKGTIYFPSEDGIMASRLIDGAYERPVKVLKDIPGSFPFISPNEDYLIFGGSSALGDVSLYLCYRKRDGSWTDYIDLSKRMGYVNENRNSGQICPIVSPDGKYMFFMAAGVCWIDASFIEELRPKE